MSEAPVKFLLGERDMPTQWVNLLVDLPGETAAAAATPRRCSRRARPT